MSSKTVGRIWDLVLSPPKQMVLLALADHADHMDCNIHPGTPLIAWKTGYSERQVKRIMKELEEDGLLVRVESRPGKPTIYRLDLSKGELKPPYVPRDERATHDKMSHDKMSHDKMSRVETSPVNMSPVTKLPGTSHGEDTPSTRDIASAKSASSNSLSQESSPDQLPAEDQKREIAPARDSTPIPYHMANGLGRTKPGDKTPLVMLIEAEPIYQAFVRGWDGITPAIESAFADTTMDAIRVLKKKIDAKIFTIEDVENCTRWKLSNPRTQGYRITFVNVDMAGYKAQLRAQGKAAQQSQATGSTDKYHDFFQR